jgi:hypothetical protein
LASFQDPFSNRMNDSIAKKQCSKASGGGRKSGGTVDKTYSIVASTPVKNSQSSGAFAKKPPVVALVKKSPSSVAGTKKATPVKKSPSAAAAASSGVKKNKSLSSAAVG